MSSPNWFNGKSINEVEFCTEFVQSCPLKCIGGKLYGIDGELSDSEICHDISVMLTELKKDTFSSWLKTNFEKYNIRFSTYIKTDNREVRGYKGIRSRFRNIILE